MQAAQLAERVEHLDIDMLVCSDFVRAQQTIAPAATAKKLEPTILPEVGEILEPSSLFGVLETDERVQTYRHGRNTHIEDPDWRFEDGENYADVQTRINAAKAYLENVESENILVVSHAFYICLFSASILLNRDYPSQETFDIAVCLEMSNTGISYMTFHEEQWRLVVHNDHAHFAE